MSEQTTVIVQSKLAGCEEIIERGLATLIEVGTELVETPSGDVSLESDPSGYMALVLNRAKGWLAEAASIDDVRDTKALAVGYENVIREKELAFDAQLSATEIVRRCERRIGELVRQGQRDGTILRQGQTLAKADHPVRALDDEPPRRVTDFFPEGSVAQTDSYALADVPAEAFEEAIAQARDEGNLSRANVVRKVKGKPKKPETRAAGAPRPAAVRRVAAQAADLALPLSAINLPKSCARLTESERSDALKKCKQGRKAITSLVNALLAASEKE